MNPKLLLIISLFTIFSTLAQNADSTYAKYYFEQFQIAEYVDQDLAEKYIDSGLYYALLTKDDKLIGRGYMYKGWLEQDKSAYRAANKFFYKSLTHLKRANDLQGIADAYGNLGNSYLDIQEYQKSLNYQLLALDANDAILKKELTEDQLYNAMIGKTYALHNIGAIYGEIEMYDKALDYNYKSLAFELKSKNWEGVAISYKAMATTFKELKKIDSAIYYFEKSIDLFESDKVENLFDYAAVLESYATLKGSGLSKDKKNEMLLHALDIRREFEDADGEARTLISIAEEDFDLLSTDSLSAILQRAYELIEAYELDGASERYFKVYSKYNSRIGRFDSAYFALENYLELKAESDEKRRTHDLIAGDIKHQLRTKNFNDSLKIEQQFAEERAVYHEDIAEVQNIIYLSVIGFIILIVTLSIIISKNRRRKRLNDVLSEKNQLIQEQKEIVEEKNHSISDSINYARRLQSAILPTREQVNKFFPNSFLFFRPKDIVSGDFYWFEQKGDVCFMAVADCTGHGVPGAMVSVVCSNALNRCVNEFGLLKPNEILDKAREIVVETLGKSGEDVTDGMDIALAAINFKKKKVQFSGANNALWLVRSNENIGDLQPLVNHTLDMYSLIELKGDKQPVGLFDHMTNFTLIEFDYQKGDAIYMTSDGYADQFGGEHGKKFKYRPLKDEILGMQLMSMDTQVKQLERVFDDWIGNQEQVDDLCFIGFKL